MCLNIREVVRWFRTNCIASEWDVSTSNRSHDSSESFQICKFMELVDVDGV